MSRIAYVNGRYLPFRDAKVHVEDRGYQFADGVYEVCEVRGGRLIDERRHIDAAATFARRIAHPHADVAAPRSASCCARWWRGTASATASSICRSPAAWRGATPPFRRRRRAPSVVVTARPLNMARNEALAEKGIAVVSVPDNRWGRVDIKTVGLLPNVLARQAAIDRGARDAWFVDKDGKVTEAASANAWIVTADGTLVTRHADHAILRGITRAVMFDVVKAQGLTVEERGFTLEEAYAAREAFETSATQIVMPVVQYRRPHHRRRQAGPGRHRAAAGVSPLCGGRVGAFTPVGRV